MSSSLNLNPDLAVIGVQAGIFLANMFVVKKLMLEPYLKVKAARDKSTGGNQGDASSLLDKAKEMDQQIAVKMRDAHKQAAETREAIKSAAQNKRNDLVQKAEMAKRQITEKVITIG